MIGRIKQWLNYNPPTALTSENWDKFYEEYKKNAPIRYFLTNKLYDAVYDRPKTILHNVKYKLLYRFHPRHRYHYMRTGLEPGYYDYDYRLLYTCFSALQDYVERELAHMELICHPEEHKGRRKWFRDTFISDRYPDLGLRYLAWEISLTDDSPDQAKAAKEIHKLYFWWTNTRPNREELSYKDVSDLDKEELWRKEDTKMLIRLMKVRSSMWT